VTAMTLDARIRSSAASPIVGAAGDGNPGSPLVVSGGTYAALVTAWAAVRAGRPVRLLLPERGVGSGFAPLRVGGHDLELGVRLLELDYGDDPAAEVPPLAEYRPGMGGHRPWQPLVRQFLTELLGGTLVEAARPEVFVNGRFADDFYFTTDLRGLRAVLTDAQAHAIASQVRSGEGAGVLRSRAANWRTGGIDVENLTLAEASRANHGGVFHDLAVESVCAKVLPGGSASVLATMRRKVWMPVFWPSTLADAVRGRPLGFAPDRRFHTVRPGGTGAVVSALLGRLAASPGVEIVRVAPLASVTAGAAGAGATVRLEYADGTAIEATHPVVAHGPDELFAAVGADYRPTRVPAVLAWLAVEAADLAHDPSAVTIADPAVPAFRVSGSDGADGRRVLCVELGHDCPAADAADAARTTLSALGMVTDAARDRVEVLHTAAVPSFVTPDAANRSAFGAAAAVLRDRLPGVAVVGGATAFGADALNEQIVQGLHIAEVLACPTT
jgi:hypothetical protein